MTGIIFYALFAVTISFTCSLAESFILSVRPSYLKVKIKEGIKSAQLVYKLRDNLERSLIAILTVNTFANMLGAAGVGAQVQKLYGNTYVTIFSVFLTLIILIFSEIIPKSIGARKWRMLVPFAGYVIHLMIYCAYPLVILLEKTYKKDILTDDLTLSREEVIETAQIGASEGSLEEKESVIIKNLLCLDSIPVSEVMTPRTVIYSFEQDTKIQTFLKDGHKTIRFSRIPVYKETIDNIVGVVHRYKILEASSQDLHNLTLKNLIKPLHSVPETMSIRAAIDQFLKRKEHLFCVVDNYGVLSGIITLEDAIETLLGVEIVDEYDSVTDMRALALEKWKEKRKSKNIPKRS